MWIKLLVTLYGLLNVGAQMNITVAERYIVQGQPFYVNCSSDIPPLGDAVSFGKESVDILNLRYVSTIPACYATLSSGLQPPFQCSDQCRCSNDRKSYQWTFNGREINEINTFHCTMLFPMSGTITTSILVVKAIAPELDGNLSSQEVIRFAEGQHLNITVTVKAHPEPSSVFWIFRYNENTDPVKIPQNCTTDRPARYTCSFLVQEATLSNLGRYVLHFENDIGSPLNVPFVVQGSEKPSPPELDTVCGISKVIFYWISRFNGGDKQVFYVIASSTIHRSEKILAVIHDEGVGTSNKFSMEMEPGQYIFYIFTNNSNGGVNSSTITCNFAVPALSKDDQDTCNSLVTAALFVYFLIMVLIVFMVSVCVSSWKRMRSSHTSTRK